MELDFCNEGPVTFDKYEIIYQQLLTKTISHLRLDGDYYVSVTIIDNETIHGINKQYRNVDRPTDVISFALLDNEQNKPIPGMIIDLGEIEAYPNGSNWNATIYDSTFVLDFPNKNPTNYHTLLYF